MCSVLALSTKPIRRPRPLPRRARIRAHHAEAVVTRLVASETLNGGLHAACRLGRLVDAILLCSVQSHALGVQDAEGWTPLHYAAEYGHVNIATVLLAAGANVDALGGPKGQTAMHRAAARGWVPVLQTLVASNASVSLEDTDGCLALDLAAPHSEAREELGARIEVFAGFHDAVGHGSVAAVQRMIDSGTHSLDERNDLGCTPLHISAVAGHFSISRRLLHAGADSNALTSMKDTPLHYACCIQHEAMVTLLLQAGADPTLQNGDSLVPGDLARGHVGILALLRGGWRDCER